MFKSLKVEYDGSVSCTAFIYCEDGDLIADTCDDGFYFETDEGNLDISNSFRIQTRICIL